MGKYTLGRIETGTEFLAKDAAAERHVQSVSRSNTSKANSALSKGKAQSTLGDTPAFGIPAGRGKGVAEVRKDNKVTGNVYPY